MIIGSVLVFYPLSRVIGRTSCLFWASVGLTLSVMWSALMTGKNDFSVFIVSRGFAGFFGTIVGVFGPRMLMDMFFLHQRGRAYTVFHFWLDLGNAAGPSMCAFVASASNWRWAFWWTMILSAVSALLIFLFVPCTDWDRSPDAVNRVPAKSFVRERINTFMPGTQITPQKSSLKELVSIASIPFKMALTPVAILTELFCLLNFGFYVSMNALAPVWLQKPVKLGGWGFTPIMNARFQFSHWIGIIIALIYGQLVSDSIPLLATRFNRGKWKPEFRLHALWFPALICNPLGLGIFGWALQNHRSWVVLAVSHVLVTFGSLCITPITVNYLSECFKKNVEETAIVLNAFRIAFGLSIAFYINSWVADVGFAWTYGTMSFIQVFSWVFLLLLFWKGHEIRQFDPFGLILTEEGESVLEKQSSSSA